VRFETGSIETLPEVLARLVAIFCLSAGEDTVYQEDGFPFLELSTQMMRWVKQSVIAPRPFDFEFNSMSFPETGVVWIRQQDDGWRVGSMYQNKMSLTIFDDERISGAISKFYQESRSYVPRSLLPALTDYVDLK
jgi:hypothetical protein